jgi:hypothetical protein
LWGENDPTSSGVRKNGHRVSYTCCCCGCDGSCRRQSLRMAPGRLVRTISRQGPRETKSHAIDLSGSLFAGRTNLGFERRADKIAIGPDHSTTARRRTRFGAPDKVDRAHGAGGAAGEPAARMINLKSPAGDRGRILGTGPVYECPNSFIRTNNEAPCTIRVPLTKRDQPGKAGIKGFSSSRNGTRVY